MLGMILCALIHLEGEICNIQAMQTPFAYKVEDNSGEEVGRAALLSAYGSIA